MHRLVNFLLTYIEVVMIVVFGIGYLMSTTPLEQTTWFLATIIVTGVQSIKLYIKDQLNVSKNSN